MNKGIYYIDSLYGDDFGIFNTDKVGNFESGYCFALYSTKEEAERKVKELNKEI